MIVRQPERTEEKEEEEDDSSRYQCIFPPFAVFFYGVGAKKKVVHDSDNV